MTSEILRILDANANRAREALRVLEDYARFALNNDQLCSDLKNLRHSLADATRAILPEAILHRDTAGDVGTGIKTENELKRNDLSDVIVAAGKRLGEALRVIEEFLKTSVPQSALQIEKSRYRFYDIEKAIARTLGRGLRFESVRLYVLITQGSCKLPWLEAARQAIEGGADCLQLREKDQDGGELLCRAKQFVELCKAHNVISIINDRADIALLAGADGVHVGQGDLPCTEARKLLGAGKIVGVSTHEIAHARQAVLDGADYIGVGPIYKSPTKPRDFVAGLDYARQVAREIRIPAVAIAGITQENVDEVLATGIKAVAVTNAVTGTTDVLQAAKALKAKLVGQTFLSVNPSSKPVGQTFLSVDPPPKPVGQTFLSVPSSASRTDIPVCPDPPEVKIHRRHMPHWKMDRATYFVTFRLAEDELSMAERQLVMQHIQSGDGKFYRLLAAVVMPDHVHLLIEPTGEFDLSRVMKGIKGVSSRMINDARGTNGTIWQSESFDRIVRDQAEFEEKLQYIVNNPAKRELVSDGLDYPALYVKYD